MHFIFHFPRSQVINMISYLDQIRNRQAPFLDCHSSHIAVKSGQPLTKIDEQSSKELEKKPKFLKNVAAASEECLSSTGKKARLPWCEEPPESLFMKELRRRGMTPTSLLEEKERIEYGANDEMGKEDRGFSTRNAVSTEIEKSLANQRERSMQLNSEGLEGLIPRARLLLTIGGTFFLGFWPLILITVALFSALYLYFGSTFIHDGSSSPISPPQYIDPYELLEDERISQIAPRVN
ncbi:unnamed protein product [Prunus armeniaca]|uniref:Uncharacterized protein n=1 Tax=Prunus armeniaca TaxID=36596 RepID=A0A6J5YC08_PRUAR|nr:unnamed protein product [Prunus armeniaca]